VNLRPLIDMLIYRLVKSRYMYSAIDWHIDCLIDIRISYMLVSQSTSVNQFIYKHLSINQPIGISYVNKFLNQSKNIDIDSCSEK
jgi:hypothetical protein